MRDEGDGWVLSGVPQVDWPLVVDVLLGVCFAGAVVFLIWFVVDLVRRHRS